MSRIAPFEENTIVVGDWMDIISQIPNESVDLVATDPPWETLLRWQGIGTTARMGLGRKGSKSHDPNKFFPVIPNEDLPDLVQEIHRILKPSTHCYIMCDFETLKLLNYFAIEEGVFSPAGYGKLFDSCKPLIWDKMAMGTGYTYRQQYEFVFMLWKGPTKRRLNDLSIPDVLRFKRVWGKDKLTPTQKPVGLFDCLIRQSSNEGEIVVDPFMGSGTTAVAADRLGRRWFGCDISEQYVKLALERIEADRLKRSQLGLFSNG